MQTLSNALHCRFTAVICCGTREATGALVGMDNIRCWTDVCTRACRSYTQPLRLWRNCGWTAMLLPDMHHPDMQCLPAHWDVQYFRESGAGEQPLQQFTAGYHGRIHVSRCSTSARRTRSLLCCR